MEELRYLVDHKLHTDLGNEVVRWQKEIESKKENLKSRYKEMDRKDPKTEQWKDRIIKEIKEEEDRLKLFRSAYDVIDNSQCDSFSLRKRIRIVVKQITHNILKRDGDRFVYPNDLSPQQKDIMMNIIVKGLSIIEKETRYIQERTKHEF